MYLSFSVEDVNEVRAEVIAHGLRPVTKPRNRPGGVREFFALRDPDGYNLVLFKKK